MAQLNNAALDSAVVVVVVVAAAAAAAEMLLNMPIIDAARLGQAKRTNEQTDEQTKHARSAVLWSANDRYRYAWPVTYSPSAASLPFVGR